MNSHSYPIGRAPLQSGKYIQDSNTSNQLEKRNILTLFQIIPIIPKSLVAHAGVPEADGDPLPPFPLPLHYLCGAPNILIMSGN